MWVIMMDISEVVMNPVRQRIIQFLMINGKGTVKEMKSRLNDIPTPSMYGAATDGYHLSLFLDSLQEEMDTFEKYLF